MKCPNCGKELITVEYKDIELDYCIHCHGIWFDSGELKLLNKIFPEKDFMDILPEFLKIAKTKEKKKLCPRCFKKMDKVLMQNKPPLLDVCPYNHGVWFDRGELSIYLKNNSSNSNYSAIHFLGEIF